MPPRNPPGELDEVSRMIGELSAYVHEGRHGVNNLSVKFDALALDIAKRVETVGEQLGLRLDAMDRRIAKLEAKSNEEKGARGVIGWILRSPLIGWLAALAVVIATYWRPRP